MEVEGTMGGKEGGSDGSKSNSSTRGVIFILNNLSIEDYSSPSQIVPNLLYSLENLAATYKEECNSAVDQILSSRLTAAGGFIRAIYVNFGPMGCYELNPNTRSTTPAAFKAQLRDLFQTGIVSNPGSNEVIWQKITNLSSIVSTLPSNSPKIGCRHGSGSSSQVSINNNIRDYIRAAPTEHTYVFVVGEIDTHIQAHIDDFVKVSDYSLTAGTCLRRICIALERRWNIH